MEKLVPEKEKCFEKIKSGKEEFLKSYIHQLSHIGNSAIPVAFYYASQPSP